jgi:hypothetical protein
LLRQKKKGRLKCVLGVLLMVEEAPAKIPHQPAVPIHDGRERCFVLALEKAAQQIGIGTLGRFAADQPPKLLQNQRELPAGHERDLEFPPLVQVGHGLHTVFPEQSVGRNAAANAQGRQPRTLRRGSADLGPQLAAVLKSDWDSFEKSWREHCQKAYPVGK